MAEHVAARERAALFDESSFSKLEVTGPGAAALLARACANDVVREAGRVTYTQLLNARGGIEADVTVTRLGEERFLVVTGTAFGPRDLAWLRARHAPRRRPRPRRRRHGGVGDLRRCGARAPATSSRR